MPNSDNLHYACRRPPKRSRAWPPSWPWQSSIAPIEAWLTARTAGPHEDRCGRQPIKAASAPAAPPAAKRTLRTRPRTLSPRCCRPPATAPGRCPTSPAGCTGLTRLSRWNCSPASPPATAPTLTGRPSPGTCSTQPSSSPTGNAHRCTPPPSASLPPTRCKACAASPARLISTPRSLVPATPCTSRRASTSRPRPWSWAC